MEMKMKSTIILLLNCDNENENDNNFDFDFELWRDRYLCQIQLIHTGRVAQVDNVMRNQCRGDFNDDDESSLMIVLEKWGEEKNWRNIWYKIVQLQFVNFSHNRAESLEPAASLLLVARMRWNGPRAQVGENNLIKRLSGKFWLENILAQLANK